MTNETKAPDLVVMDLVENLLTSLDSISNELKGENSLTPLQVKSKEYSWTQALKSLHDWIKELGDSDREKQLIARYNEIVNRVER